MTLFEQIQSVYPSATDLVEYVVVQNDSDGQGDYIAVWNHPTLTQPTQEQLDAVGEE